MTTLRVEHSTEKLVEFLSATSPVKTWLHNKVCGADWSVTPYADYRKVVINDPKIATLLLLTL